FDKLLLDLDLGGLESDVTDVMLGTGVVAAREVDVDWGIERDAFLKIRGKGHGVPLGIGGRVFAACVSGAGKQATSDARGVPIQPERLDGVFDGLDILFGDIGDQQILPNSETNRSAAEAVGNIRKAVNLLHRHPANGQHNPNVILAGLSLPVEADMSPAI